MLSKIRNRKQEGFTIIEVLIVLAIAGLILLVVFLAVPALQRNARNTTRREDAGNILSAVSEYVANNDGSLPAAQANLGSGSSATLGSGSVNTVPITLGYYTANNVSVVAYTAGATNSTTVDTAVVMTGATCGASGAPASGSSRSVVMLYTLEANAKQCRQS